MQQPQSGLGRFAYQHNFPANGGPQVARDPNGGQKLSWDYQGIPFTIDRMRKMVYQALLWEQQGLLRRHVESVTAGVRPKDYLSEIAAIYYYVLKNLRYVRDPVHVEYIQSPLSTLQPLPWDKANGRTARQDDCETIATTIAAMCMSIGVRCDFVTISTKPGVNYHHVFTIAHNGDAKIVVDPIPGPDTQAMLSAVVKFEIWRIEPLRYMNKPGIWGIAGAPTQQGIGAASLAAYLNGAGGA